jgi:ubiquinone/menaquinone biosynthesis C-methylase UbiE
MNVDPIARIYRYLEYVAFGRALHRCRLAQLPYLDELSQVLILGEGDGRFLLDLLNRNPRARVDVIEASAQMIAVARKRIASSDLKRVTFIQSDARTSPFPNTGYDLVVTNFFLDCLPESDTQQLIAKGTGVLKSGGHWIVGEFRVPDRGALSRIHARISIRVMYRFFQKATGLTTGRVPDYAPMLDAAGYLIMREHSERLGLIVSQLWRKQQSSQQMF